MKMEKMLPADRWEALFSNTILVRGAEYFKKRALRNLVQNDGRIEADVMGSEVYHVRIEMQDEQIADMSCDCPYAADGIKTCKHMAAVLFAALSPEKARQYKSNSKRPLKPLPPPKPNCTQVTVRIEYEDTIVQRYCAIPEVKVGDYVVFLLNGRETVGLVEKIDQMPRPIDAYGLGRSNHILKITEKPEDVSPFSIRILPPAPMCRLILAMPDGMYRMQIKRERVEKYHIRVGDTLLMDRKEPDEAVVLNMDDLATDDLPHCQFIAVRENKDFRVLLQNNVELQLPEEKKAVPEFVLHHWTNEQEEARIPFGVDRVAAFAFEDNWDVQRVVVTGARVQLDPFAFGHNESIEEISIENDLVYCTPTSFEGCECLKRLRLPYTCYHMKDEIAAKMPWVHIEYLLNGNTNKDGIIYSADMTRVICCTDRNIAIYHSPLSVTGIASHAFSGCSQMKRFLLTPFVTKFGSSCLEKCFALEELAMSYGDDVDVILLFGQEYAADASDVVLQRKDGGEETFYLPRKCKYRKLPKAKDALRTVKPEEMDAESAYVLGGYFENEHAMKEAVSCYIRAAGEGNQLAREKLMMLVRNENYREYFDLGTYDDVLRIRSIEPVLHHFGLTASGRRWAGFTEEKLMECLHDSQVLHAFLQDLSQADILHAELLNGLLKRLYPRFGRRASAETKAWFYRCVRKLSAADCTLNWRDDLLAELLSMPEYQREFLFDRVKTFYLERNPEHEKLIAELEDEALRTDIMTAYEASFNPQKSNVELCRTYLNKTEDTGDEVYQWCALLAVESYIAKCWRDKNFNLLRDVLQVAIDACQAGMYIMGKPILLHRQNLKRNIPRSFYRIIAQRLAVKGLLSRNDYQNLLGEYGSDYVDFYYRYPDYFELAKPDRVMMQYISTGWFCIPGIEIKDEEAKEAVAKRPYEAFIPLKTGNDLVVFSNPHEAVSYMMQNNLPVADYYFSIPFWQVLTIMDAMREDRFLLMPLCLNQWIPKRYVEETRRKKV